MKPGAGILFEIAFVIMMGVVLALSANHFSPRGLKFNQNYFPGSPARAPANPPRGTNAVSAPPATTLETAVARLKQNGLKVVDRSQVSALLADPRFAQNLVLLIDARKPEHYQAGHIPGAYEFDHYHAENYVPAVIPLTQVAQQIIVYCNGGECEDSEFAALMLRDTFGVPGEKIFVYPGGIKDWEESKQPIEPGQRNSGQRK